MRETTHIRYTIVILAVAMLVATGVMAQTATGRLEGTIVENNGQALPGVTVTIQSPNLIGGPRNAVTDAKGAFSFVSLPPGVYSVRAVLQGFVSQERTDVKVSLGGTAIIGITMPAGKFGAEIEVTAETPVVDPTQVNTEQIYDQSYLQNSAIGSANRSYQNVLGQTGGVDYQSGAGANPSVFGSTLGENAYFIDGMDTTDPVTSTFGTNFNYDAIQEIQFQTSGFEAQYGRATGGFVNLVTKSGGNSFSGTFDIRYRDTSFYENGTHFDKNRNKTSSQITGATLGGPILRDKVWFFVSYQNSVTKLTPANAFTTRHFRGNYYLAKVTWQAAPNWRVVARGSQDPANIDNDYQVNRLPAATGFQKQGGKIYTGEMNGVLSEALLWDLFVGINRQNLDTYPQTGDLATPSHINDDTGLYSYNYENQQYSDRDRDDYVTSLTYFVDDFGGSHEFKGGIDYSRLKFRSANCSTGDLAGLECYNGQIAYSYEDILSDPANPDSPPAQFVLWQYFNAGFLDDTGKLNTGYVQDTWRPSSNLTLKLGVRYDKVTYDTNTGNRIADMHKFQPRVGVAWDVTGDSKNVVRANWGRFMHPSALTLPDFARTQLSTSEAWLGCDYYAAFGFPSGTPAECQTFAASRGYDYMSDPTGFYSNGWMLSPANIFGSAPNEIAPNLKPMYADEYSIAYERALWQRSSLEITYVNKKTKDIFEDTCDGNFPTPTEGASCDYYFMYNIPGLRRSWKGAVVKFESRDLDWLTILASYTYGDSKGSVEYDQNAGSDFDIYPYHYVNRYGYLSDGAKSRFKLNGFVLLPLNFTVGFQGSYTSGFPYNTLDNSSNVPGMLYGDYFVEPRGSRRADSVYDVDLEASKGWTTGPVRLELIGTIYNVLSSEHAISVCEQFTDGCTTIDKDTQVHVAFGQPIDWQTPRRYEVGFRVEF